MGRTFWVAAVFGALGLGAVAFAARPEAPEDGDRPGRRPDMAQVEKAAGLTDAQVAQLRKLRQDEAKAGIRRRADLQVARMELNELLEAPTVDEKAVAVKVKALSDMEAAALKARVDGRVAMRKIVTAEQFEKLRSLRRERGRGWDGPGNRGRRPGGFGPGGHRPDGPDGPDGPHGPGGPGGPPNGPDDDTDDAAN